MSEEEAINICRDIRDREDHFGSLAIQTVLDLLKNHGKKDEVSYQEDIEYELERLFKDNSRIIWH